MNIKGPGVQPGPFFVLHSQKQARATKSPTSQESLALRAACHLRGERHKPFDRLRIGRLVAFLHEAFPCSGSWLAGCSKVYGFEGDNFKG